MTLHIFHVPREPRDFGRRPKAPSLVPWKVNLFSPNPEVITLGPTLAYRETIKTRSITNKHQSTIRNRNVMYCVLEAGSVRGDVKAYIPVRRLRYALDVLRLKTSTSLFQFEPYAVQWVFDLLFGTLHQQSRRIKIDILSGARDWAIIRVRQAIERWLYAIWYQKLFFVSCPIVIRSTWLLPSPAVPRNARLNNMILIYLRDRYKRPIRRAKPNKWCQMDCYIFRFSPAPMLMNEMLHVWDYGLDFNAAQYLTFSLPCAPVFLFFNVFSVFFSFLICCTDEILNYERHGPESRSRCP